MAYAPLKGIDVSHYQTDENAKELSIRWVSVAEEGYSFAYIRLGRGVPGNGGEVDQDAGLNAYQATHAGMVWGWYHRVVTTQGSPVEHARWALGQMWRTRRSGFPEPQLAFACDYEEQKVGGGQWVADYLGTLRDALGERRMVLYSSGSYFGKYIESSGYSDPETKLWIAHTDEWPYVGGDPARPKEKALLPGLPKFRHPQEVIHQWSHEGTVSGVDGSVDLNVAMGPLPVRI